ncbi:hypothetical protein [Paenarthrobacter sp. NPDC091669]|uniref:hypothetical protein n=1 Tax=Paenarthrobacter sp. NPDC091669 TaxID=3364384 RepID=UPI00382906A3
MQSAPGFIPFAVAFMGFAMTFIYDRVKTRCKKMVLLYSHTAVMSKHVKVRGLHVRFYDHIIATPVLTGLALINYGRRDLLRKDFDGGSLRFRIYSRVVHGTSADAGCDWSFKSAASSVIELKPSVVQRKATESLELLCDGFGRVELHIELGEIDVAIYEEGDFLNRIKILKIRMVRFLGISLAAACIAGILFDVPFSLLAIFVGAADFGIGPWFVED